MSFTDQKLESVKNNVKELMLLQIESLFSCFSVNMFSEQWEGFKMADDGVQWTKAVVFKMCVNKKF